MGYQESPGEWAKFVSGLSKGIQERDATVKRSYGQETSWIIIQGKQAVSIGGKLQWEAKQ